MAHRILGLDVGNRAIKLAIVDKTLRQTVLSGWDQEPVPAGANEPERIEALRRLLLRNVRPDDVIAVGMPSSVVMHRTLLFPFRDDKAIAEAVGFELENHIPTPLSDLVVDQVRLGEKDAQTEVLAVAAPIKEVERWIEMLRTAGTDPRRLGLNGLAYASLLRMLPACATGTTMLVDVGVRTAEVVVTQEGQTQYLRSLSLGTEAIAAGFATHFQGVAASDEAFAQHAWLLPAGALPESQNERLLHEATVAALAPLLRELRQTLSAWMRRAHTRPDRIVLTGGLARLAGLHEYLERFLGVPVEPVRLDTLPDQRLSDAAELGDIAAVAVSQALASAEARPGQDVDFRQGELAYEGDFKVLRARLPQMVAFVVIALCLLGIRTSLTWRTLLSEQDQQLQQLTVVSKAVTGKPAASFEDLRKELKREPAIDVAGLYPDLSAFKVLEEISTIIDKVTEPPDFTVPLISPVLPGQTPPPGPAEAEAPQRPDPAMDPSAMRRAQFRAQPAPDPSAAGADGRPGASGAGRPPSGVDDKKRGDKSAKGEDEDGAAKAAKDEHAGHQIELASVQIERNGGTVRGDADTQDALLALQQAIEGHRCFSKAKSSSDKISFERHNGWYKFTIQFEIACPAETKGKPKAGETKGKGKGDKAGDKTTDKGDKTDDESTDEE
jgi:type IV pilus assembly protein PilM